MSRKLFSPFFALCWNTDAGAFYRGFVTVTPIKLDWTDREALKKVKKWGMSAEARE